MILRHDQGARADAREAIAARVAAVKDRVRVSEVVGRVVKLRGRGPKWRGQCPFHGSKSDSLAIDDERGFWKCWGCDARGDLFGFVQDHDGVAFIEALKRLEDGAGLDGAASLSTMRHSRRDQPVSHGDPVDSVTMGRWAWKSASPDHAATRRWYRSRGLPDRAITEARLSDIRFNPACPIVPWRIGAEPSSVPSAPAIVALVRQAGSFTPSGVHLTFLNPGGTAKMVRQRRDGSDYPARKMCGTIAGGGVLLGRLDAIEDAPLAAGEGIETVFGGLIATDLAQGVGWAVLSLENLQGRPKLWAKGVWPLFRLEADLASPCAAFRHLPPVTLLIDADMKPLRGTRGRNPGSGSRAGGEWLGYPIVERPNGPIVNRAISGAERAMICAALAHQRWRRMGCPEVRAVRPSMGQDFNDAVRSIGAGGASNSQELVVTGE